MEGAGLYVACQDAKVDWILVKSICDWADGKKDQDKATRQQQAAQNAAAFVLHTLQHAPLERLRIQMPSISQPSSALAVTGTIYDHKNNVLESAEIFIEGDTRSTKSNRNGYFTLELNPNLTEWRLIISYNGQSKHRTVNKNEINKPVSIKLKKKL